MEMDGVLAGHDIFDSGTLGASLLLGGHFCESETDRDEFVLTEVKVRSRGRPIDARCGGELLTVKGLVL